MSGSRPMSRRSLGNPSSSSSSSSSDMGPPSRIPKRAHSIAPSDPKPKVASMPLKERENLTQPITRTNGPRKSSIRTRPPQVFASPTGMSRSPTAPPPRQSIAGRGGEDASVVVTTVVPSKKRPAEAQSPSAAARSRKSMAPAATTTLAFGDSKTIDVNEERKKRRVTFSTRQERTDFIRDEPTMHIRAPVESDLASMSQSTASSTPSSQRDSLVPRLHGFGADVDDDEESSSEEESSEEEDASAVDMELATMSDIVAPRSQQLEEGQDEAEEEEEESMAMEFTQVRGTIVKLRRSSTARSEADESSVAMDLTYGADEGQEDAEEEDESAMEFTTAIGGIQSMGKGKLRARDSLAPRPPRPSSRPSLSATSHAANESSMMMSMDLDDASKSAMDMTGNFGAIAEGEDEEEDAEDKSAMVSIVDGNQSSSAMDLTVAQGAIAGGNTTPPRSRPSYGSTAVPPLPFQRSPTKSPGTPSRFRRSLLGGISDSPSSPARRVQVPIDPEELARMKPSTPSAVSKDFSSQFLTHSARRASPERRPIFANAVPLRKSMGGALPSAHSLKPGKVSAIPQQKSRGDNRSSIVAAVLPPPSSSDFSYDGTEDSNASAVEAAAAAAAAMAGPSQMSSTSSSSENHPFYDAPAPPSAPSPPDLDDEISQPPPRNLTLSEFFSLSGMNFHDDTRPLKVRVLPPKDGPPPAEGSKHFASQFKAMAGSVPMLETLVEACRELKQSVSDGSAVLREIEERFVESPPDLVRELLSLSSEAEKKEMESQFKLQKQAARAIAKEGYLGWCLDNQYGPDIVAALEATKAGLESDLVTIKSDCLRMEQEILPALRERRNLLRAQVHRVKQRQTEIERCPLSDLEALHGGMAELLPEVQSRRSVHREKSEALERMRAKLEENLATKAELEAAIEAARKVCEQIQGYTRGEAARLAAEVRHIERLHLWKIQAASLGKLHLVHDSVFDVVVVLEEGSGLCESVELALTPSARAEGDVLVAEMLEALREDINAGNGVEGWPVAKLVRHISTAWTSCRHLQSDLARLALRFPIDVVALAPQQLPGEPRNVAVHATMLLPEERTKLRLTLRVDLEALIYGDDAALFTRREESGEEGELQAAVAAAVRVEAVYGQGDAQGMAGRVAKRLRSHDFVLGSGALAEACASVVDVYA